ncbi:MAG: UDP-3-O-(3-hydroxymyristoyl)glucosamine N-acyltransferase [Opitutales bacterium]|nr:UDP-3-O-(3-hydroxymyristoyl)glucosamine N-acyltransferase [Opitutales bacterium]
MVPHTSVSGGGGGPFTGLSALEGAGEADISFLSNPRNARMLDGTRAGIVFVPETLEADAPPGRVYVRMPNPSLGLALVAERMERSLDPKPPAGVHPSAVVDPSAEVDGSAYVGPLCVVEAGVRVGAGAVLTAQVYLGRGSNVGEDTRMHAQAVLHRYCELGRRCVIHSGAVIGADGFGFETEDGRHRKVPQIGRVVVGDDVEIGANSAIDRARFAETRVGRGTKIDNLVQIGHNVTIGEHCFLCAGVGIAGSVKVGNYVVIAGQVGTAGHIEIGDFTQVGGQAGVSKSLPPKSLVTGTPATDLKHQRRLEAMVRRLPKLFKKVGALEAQLAGE